eukprot:Pgem_evm1s6038
MAIRNCNYVFTNRSKRAGEICGVRVWLDGVSVCRAHMSRKNNKMDVESKESESEGSKSESKESEATEVKELVKFVVQEYG